MYLNIMMVVIALTGAVPMAFGQSGPSQNELEMAAKSPAHRVIAEQFGAAAAARDIVVLAQLLSPAIVARTGKEAVQKFILGQVVPFFVDHREIGRSVTTTNTTDANGNAGFAYYMYSVPNSGKPKPFVIYVVEENGRKTVANILLDRFVEGRHR